MENCAGVHSFIEALVRNQGGNSVADLSCIDNELLTSVRGLLPILLKDHTTQHNIFWATDNYAERGTGYQFSDPITIEAISGENEAVIVPRAFKSRQQQQQRSRKMAEVFTPSWVCNKQCNLVDEAWFGREGVFNMEIDKPDGTHSWIVNPESIVFPEGRNWHDYVADTQLEITCGEAPYLVSRYDTVTGNPISIDRRIGLLDRKLRVVGENTETVEDWIAAARLAFQNTYGYEWQGDNIVIARTSLLITFIEYFYVKFSDKPDMTILKEIANIISWNIWQMDGLKGVIPNSCKPIPVPVIHSIFGPDDDSTSCVQKFQECPGCKSKNIHTHNGIKCLIMDWEEGKPIEFVSLIRRKR